MSQNSFFHPQYWGVWKEDWGQYRIDFSCWSLPKGMVEKFDCRSILKHPHSSIIMHYTTMIDISIYDCVRDQNFQDKSWAPSTFSSQTSLITHPATRTHYHPSSITVIRQKGRKPQVKCLSWPSCENLALWALLPLDYSTIVFITINI